MPGLLEEQMGQVPPQQPGAGQQQGMPPQQPPAGGMPPEAGAGQGISPEEAIGAGKPRKATEQQQQMYNLYVGNGLKIIHSEETRDKIINMLKRGKPVDSLADTTVLILDKLDKTAQHQGENVSDEVRLSGSVEIMNELISVGEASGAFPEGLDDTEKQAAYRIAVGKYLQKAQRAGRYKPRDLIAAAERVAQANPDANVEQEAIRLSKMTNPRKAALPTPQGAPVPPAGGAAPPAGGAPPQPPPKEQLK